MVPTSTIHTKQLAAIMQRNCTVKVSDIRPVIEEMIETMRDQLQDSKRVHLDGLGSFKIGINCKGARSAKAFTVTDNVEDVHIVFTPEISRDSAGNRSKTFLEGVAVQELPENKVIKEDEEPEP
jgi:predicted histone-like DNA-binding protein